MDYEKKYKEALERAKAMIKVADNQDEAIGFANNIFPELAESKDEKIRKALIRFHKSTIDIDGIKGADVIAWLEKQGEQKSQRMISAEAKEAMYGKPAWSEEDEKIITGIINDIQKRLEDYPLEQLAEIYFKEIDWLKSLKQRIGG